MGTTNSRPTTPSGVDIDTPLSPVARLTATQEEYRRRYPVTNEEESRLSPEEARESFGANGTQNIIDSLLSWGPWQTITHLAVTVLFIYVIYVLITMPEQRTLTNLLLLLIALAVAVQIHQNINLQRKLLNGN